MTWTEFAELSAGRQLDTLLLRGTYLTRRWEEETEFSLYYVANPGRGFFVEVACDQVCNNLRLAAGGGGGAVLEPYLLGFALPALDFLP